jgi:hypothetical protein
VKIVVEKERSQYWSYCPSVPGGFGLGDIKKQAKDSIMEGLRLYSMHEKEQLALQRKRLSR